MVSTFIKHSVICIKFKVSIKSNIKASINHIILITFIFASMFYQSIFNDSFRVKISSSYIRKMEKNHINEIINSHACIENHLNYFEKNEKR